MFCSPVWTFEICKNVCRVPLRLLSGKSFPRIGPDSVISKSKPFPLDLPLSHLLSANCSRYFELVFIPPESLLRSLHNVGGGIRERVIFCCRPVMLLMRENSPAAEPREKLPRWILRHRVLCSEIQNPNQKLFRAKSGQLRKRGTSKRSKCFRVMRSMLWRDMELTDALK